MTESYNLLAKDSYWETLGSLRVWLIEYTVSSMNPRNTRLGVGCMQFPLLTAPLSCRVQCTFAIVTVFYYRINRNINTITRHYYVCMYVCIIPAAQAVEGQDHLGHQ